MLSEPNTRIIHIIWECELASWYFMARLQVAFFGTTRTCKYLYSKHNFLVPTANYANLPKRVLACFKKLSRSAEEQTDIVKERQMAVQVSALMTLFDMMTRIK